ncbi:MAG: hypothetical protein LBV55_04155 [Acholeplasmatales bacterium]|jgi:hypothetical protein|nr:hypothetical protein [Acholeplasmatales bacterium]
MEVIAKRHQFNQKASNNSTKVYIIVGIIFLIVGIVLSFIPGSFTIIFAAMGYALGGIMLLLGILYAIRIKKVFSGSSDLILFDESNGDLELHPEKSQVVKENIKNLTNVTSRLASTRYATYSYGRLFLQFGSKVYVFSLVADLHETSTKILINQEKFKKNVKAPY